MNEEHIVKRFPLATEFSRLVDMVADCEAELLEAKYSTGITEWEPNIFVQALFDEDEIVDIVVKVRKKKEDSN